MKFSNTGKTKYGFVQHYKHPYPKALETIFVVIAIEVGTKPQTSASTINSFKSIFLIRQQFVV